MFANYVNEQHDTWDQFLREFAYAIRTAVNETTGKTPAELFLGRKLITPFLEISDGIRRNGICKGIHRVNKRALSFNYKTNHSVTKYRKKNRREETVTTTTSGYYSRIGKREESRPTIERKTQQGGPSRSRKGRERNDSPYIEERTRSSNKNARRGGDQQLPREVHHKPNFSKFNAGGTFDTKVSTVYIVIQKL
ncbi:hypothetical protein TNCV_2226871 [Trichonephila clavipes]|uniref:Uncharacterized protein n=1 Tax=Trichonephila clavipes TaxID=2585209 RepID=A0A8X6WF46_TRICX|nr:hypothetical protein TNCV_2226871 [Trichonephila clavipes]